MRSERARFLTFVATGGIAAGVNVLARIGFERVMSYEAAVVPAYLVGMATAFVLARLLVFEASGTVGGQAARFAMVNALAFAQVWVVSVGLARLLLPALGFGWHAELVAHLVGVASPVVSSYFLHKHFSFRAVDA